MCVSHLATAFIRSTDVVHMGGIGGPLKLFSLMALVCVSHLVTAFIRSSQTLLKNSSLVSIIGRE
jgi:hypothetical protein